MTMRRADLVATARSLGAATVHEAVGRIGALPADLGPVDPTWRIAGPVRTVVAPSGDNLWLHRAIESAQPGEVLVVETGDHTAMWGYWGEIMSVAAIAAGIEGLILQGGCRDHQRLVDLGFPVFSFGPCIRGTVKRVEHNLGGLDVPIVLGQVSIRSGDLIVGDTDGVVAIPASQAPSAIAKGTEREEREAEAMEQLRHGATTVEVFGFPPPRPDRPDSIARLRRFETCQISDALDSLASMARSSPA